MKAKIFLLLTLFIAITAFAYHDLIVWVEENKNWEFLLMIVVMVVGSIVYCVLTSEDRK